MLTGISLPVILLMAGTFICINILYLIKDQLREKRAQYFFLLVLSALIWSLGYIFEILLEDEGLMILWAKAEYIGIPYLSVFWLLFCSSDAGKLRKITDTKLSYLLLIIPLLTTAFTFTNELHHLIWAKIKFSYIGTHRVLSPEYGILFWIHAIYAYVLLTIGSVLMISNAVHTSFIYRRRAMATIFAVFVPWISNVVYISKTIPFDLTPLAFTAATTILLITTYRYKLVDITPIARNEVIESIADAVIVLDNNNRIIDMNRSAENLLKTSRKRVIGSKAFEVFADYGELINLLRQKNPMREVCTKKGERKPIYYEIKFFPIKDKVGNVCGKVVVIHDITTIKRAEEYANEQRKKLQELNKKLEEKVRERTEEIERLLQQKDEFIKQLGHDLKNPLTPLIALLPMVRDNEENPNSRRLLDIAIRNVNYIKNLVTDTLNLARLNMPDVKFNIEDVNLRDAVEESIVDNMYIIRDKNIFTENQIASNIMVKADKLRLKEVFSNLISNSVKFTPTGGKISFGAEVNKDEVKVYVKDTGIGLEEKDKKRIFDEFYKAVESKHSVEGSGLGLTICKRIIEKHGGRIWAESEGRGKGTVIYFTLPIGGRLNGEEEKGFGG